MRAKGLSIACGLGLGLTLGLLWLLAAGSVQPVRADSFTVTTTVDENDGSCSDGDCSLRDAIILANGNGEADTITLESGIYVLSIAGADEDACRTGDLDITGTLTLVGQGPQRTIIDANGIDRVFHLLSGANTVVISGVTIMNGSVGASVSGGGIFNHAADLILINTVVTSNTAGYGGGVFVREGSATLSSGQIVNNTANNSGGGLYVRDGRATLSGGQIVSNTANKGGGVFVAESTAVFTQTGSASIIANNTATTNGGGVFVRSGRATLDGGQIVSNTANYGGGVYIYYSRATLDGGQIVSNTANDGGGVYVGQGTAVFVQTDAASAISGNTANNDGGGVYVYEGRATLDGGRVVSNTAHRGGGVFVAESTAVLVQTAGAIAGNTASNDGDGGGVYIDHGRATLDGGQIVSNTAKNGGGVFVAESTATFTQKGAASIIANNTATTNGGGVYMWNGRVTLSDGRILGNTAYNYGGGLCVYEGRATLDGGQIVSNTAYDGGGVFIFWDTADFIQTGAASVVAGNTADNDGGGVYIYEGRTTLDGGQILGNTAHKQGGGVFAYHGRVTLNGGRIADNTAVEEGGGVYLAYDSATLSVNSGQIASNTANLNGGGVYVLYGSATMSGGQIISNTAGRCGGGFYATNALTLVNSTLSGNRTDVDSGGGLYAVGGPILITHTTIASNTAASGGGGVHRLGGTVLLQDSIIAHNDPANCGGTITSNGHNLEDADTCNLTASGDITDTDPLLDPLTEDNGTLIHPLRRGSPAIDAGVCIPGIATDQRGVTRPLGKGCDIGAYEYPAEIFLPLVLRE